MCLAVFKKCECGASTVQLHLRDNLLPPEVVTRLFCPACPGDQALEPRTMLADNGWLLEYDMVLARGRIGARALGGPAEVSPAYLFDQGYCTWLETYPGERDDIRAEKEELLKLRKIDQHRYLQEIMAWNINRLKELKIRGWRKARAA